MLGFDHKYIEKAKNVQEKKPRKTRLQHFSDKITIFAEIIGIENTHFLWFSLDLHYLWPGGRR